MSEGDSLNKLHVLVGLAIVSMVLGFIGVAIHHITGDWLLSVCFPILIFFIVVRTPSDDG